MSRFRVIPFESDLIDEVAGMIAGLDSGSENTMIVFPGRRPSLYLKENLARRAQSAFFPPTCFSFEEFVDHLARRKHPGAEDIDRSDAIWLIFTLITTLPVFDGHPFRTKTFGEFLGWGSHLLNFIERLDTENIDNEALVNVESNAAIGYDIPQSVNELLANISVLRQEFHTALARGSWFTRGTKHLAAAEEAKEASGPDHGRVLFAGIFGLTGTEKSIVKSLWDAGRCDVIVSGGLDKWPLLGEIASYLKATPELGEKARDIRPVIHLHSAHDTHAEAIAAYHMINESSRGPWAVILPAPESLFPVLNLIADRIDTPCNISLGYPVDRTALFGLVRSILDAACGKRPDGLYPVNLYLDVVLHPFVKNMFPDTDLRGLLLYIERSLTGDAEDVSLAGRSGILPDEIETFASVRGEGTFDAAAITALKRIHVLFFRHPTVAATIHDMATSLESILEAVLDATDIRSYALSGPLFTNLFGTLEALKRALFANETLSANPVKNAQALHDIVLGRLTMADIPFDTHPIEELEILGLLEARSISFERLVILDVNEGILPGPRQVNPVVPIGVFEALGIPTPALSEAIYRYNFYRLIGSAREVHLIFRGSADRQRSQYIEEIIWNEEKQEKTLDVMPVRQNSLPVNLKREILPPVIEKTPSIVSALYVRGFSPSMLDAYVACPLFFYFTRLIGLKEHEGFSTDIGATNRGDIIHRILFDTFLPLQGIALTRETENIVLENLDKALQKHFTESSHSGEYYLFRKMAQYKLRSFVKAHLKNCEGPFIVQYLEEKLTAQFLVDGGPVNLSGKVDRIDRDASGEKFTVNDYKSGSGRGQYPASVLNKTDFLDIASIHEHVPSFQLPVYMNIFSASKGVPIEDISARLILLGKNTEEPFYKTRQDNRPELIAAYTDGIRTVISHMLNPDTPFAAFDTKKCMECSVRDMCHV
jgi:ATP-dependent helicase/nuclease subunit B